MGASGTYTHLRDGSWGVRVAGKASDGETVTVRKKDGATKTETVRRVLWSGRDSKSGQTISLCSINGSQRNGSSGQRERCDDCGYTGGHRDDCSLAAGGQSYYNRHGNYVLGADD